MSTTIMAVCWPIQIPPTPKAVLISLADNANDQGECWPSLTTIAARTCFGRSAVIDAIRWLEEHHLLAADRSNGRHTRYEILVRNDLLSGSKPVRLADRSAKRTGSPPGPLSGEEVTKAVHEPDGSGTQTGPADAPTSPGERPYPSASRTLTVKNHQEPFSRATRLDEKWSPTAELKAQARAESPGVELDAATVQFRRHFAAAVGKLGESVDWNAKWLNWIARRAEMDSNRTPRPAPASPRSKGTPPKPTPRQRLNEHLRYLATERDAGRMSQADHDAQREEWIAKLQPEIEAHEGAEAHAA